MLVRRYLHLARWFGRELGREVVEVAPAAMDCLRDYSWPGNIRELQNVVRQALLRARGPVFCALNSCPNCRRPRIGSGWAAFRPGWPLP